MLENFQKEVPRARINITLDVEINGAKKKKELPLKILVINTFDPRHNPVPIALRERININKSNLDEVMAELSPELSFRVPNTIKQNNDELSVNLRFNKFNDFHPDQIVSQVPELNQLIAMRNLLKDLKANILDNNLFKAELEKILKEKSKLAILRSELNSFFPSPRRGEEKNEKNLF